MQFIVRSRIVQVSMASAPRDIIFNFATFKGRPLDALNAHGFVRESWVSV